MTDPMQTEREAGWTRLADSEWVNIVNHPDVLDPFKDKEEAVRMAVKLTENKLRELNGPELRSLRDALALAKSRIAELEGALQAALNAGRGTSGRIILDAQQEALARAALKEDSE